MGRSRLLDHMREILRQHHYSIRTEEAYLERVKRYILFHKKRHPSEMGEKEVSAFLTYLAVNKHVSASTQNQALSAILFLYKKALNLQPPPPSTLSFIDRMQKNISPSIHPCLPAIIYPGC